MSLYKKIRAAIAAPTLVALFNRLEHQDIDSNKPKIVRSDKKSRLLQNAALDFVVEGKFGASAAAQLREIAGGDEMALRRAAAGIRLTSSIDENRTCYLANELLLAALADRAPVPLSRLQNEWFNQLEELEIDTEARSFAKLTDAQPKLMDCVRTIEVAVASMSRTDNDVIWDLIVDQLKAVVGPAAVGGTRLSQSRLAFGIARVHIAKLFGLDFSDE